jgi:cysteine desulfurase
MAANGEVGTLQSIAEIAAACRERGVVLHTDATQAVGKIPVDVEAWGCSLLSLSAHKFYGPKGVGALYVRTGTGVVPLVSGGGQERGLRPGTLNVPGIVGLGAVSRFRCLDMDEEARRQVRLCTRLWEGVLRFAPDAKRNGHPERRLPGCLNVAFPGARADRILAALPAYDLSAGSACHSGDPEPSAVLTAMGVPADLALSSVRFGLGRSTTEEEIRALLADLEAAIRTIRGSSPE